MSEALDTAPHPTGSDRAPSADHVGAPGQVAL